MADPKGPTGPTSIDDLKTLVFILAVLWVLWYMTGGSTRMQSRESIPDYFFDGGDFIKQDNS
ncbi:MAG: hypothetical protein HZA94_00205 [Candidatus Vogelbacteria bacterium]|nr:hypothetical protein [Candidatus Vogelbacteria bacterium]